MLFSNGETKDKGREREREMESEREREIEEWEKKKEKRERADPWFTSEAHVFFLAISDIISCPAGDHDPVTPSTTRVT